MNNMFFTQKQKTNCDCQILSLFLYMIIFGISLSPMWLVYADEASSVFSLAISDTSEIVEVFPTDSADSVTGNLSSTDNTTCITSPTRPIDEKYYGDDIYYPDFESSDDSDEVVYFPTYSYAPMSPDIWRNQLAESCLKCAESKTATYASAAAMITDNANTLGLCSINTFTVTDDADTLYRFLTEEKHMSFSPADNLNDNNEDKYLKIGNLLFIGGIKDSAGSARFNDVGIITDVSEDSISIACLDNNYAVQKVIDPKTLTKNDVFINVEYESCEDAIWEELKKEFHEYNDAVLCGIMANMYQESEYNSSAIGDDGRSYGLCQWYSDRGLSLVEYAVSNNLNIDNISAQIKFLKHELETDSKFLELAEILHAIPNDKAGAYCAAYHFCTIYESPKDVLYQAKLRGSIAESRFAYYFPTDEDLSNHEESQDDTVASDIRNIDTVRYKKGTSDLIQYLPSGTIFDTVKIDDMEISGESFKTDFEKRIKITISQEVMDNLSAGWHDIYYISDNSVTHGVIQIISDLQSVEIAKPDIDVSATGLIITDAPAPRRAVDISAKQDFGVVMWYVGTTCYISTQRENVMVKAPEDCSFLFSSVNDSEFLSNICYMDLSMLDISGTRDISFMFRGVGLNTDKFELIGISGWDVSNISTARFTFCETGFGASDWSIGDLQSWRLSSVTDVTGMFMNSGHNAALWCIGDISNWDISNCVSMASMFEGAGYNSYSIILDLHLWDVSSAVSLRSMFKNCGFNSDVFSLNINGWDISNVHDMTEMFTDMGSSASSWALDSNIEFSGS